jgi:hypothetical protein
MNAKNKQILVAAALALACALAASTTHAQNSSTFDSSFTLADNDAVAPAGGSAPAETPDEQAELAKKLNNPVADLISVPIENDWDFGIGPAHAMQYEVKFQPVIPVHITEDWNLIIRTIVPVIYQEALDNNPKAPASVSQSHAGLGDTEQSFFFSPKDPVDGWILGAGPVGYYPTATTSYLGAGKWGAGPTVLALRQEYGWTYGILANQIWSFAGQQNRQNINSSFVQPFVVYTTKTYTSFEVNSESTYDWQANQATVPLNFQVQQLVKIGGHPIAFKAGYRYYVNKPDGGPDWGLRFTVTFLFPEKH